MDLTFKIEYEQLLKLIFQLLKHDLERLSNSLQKELSAKKSVENIHDLILHAPTWTESELKLVNRKHA
jgi:hypothetical protein